MGTEQTREIATSWFKYLGDGEIEKALGLCSENIEFTNFKPVIGFNDRIPWEGDRIGLEGVRESFRAFVGAATIKTEELRVLLADEDKAAGLIYEVGIVNATGREYELEYITLLTVGNGKIIKSNTYADSASIMKAIEN